MSTHTIRRITKAILLAGMIAVPFHASGQQPPADPGQAIGVLDGTAKKEAKKPFPEYAVWVVDLDRSGVVARTQLTEEGGFALSALNVPGNYLLQLVNVKKSEVVCTEGPFVLTPTTFEMRQLEIECGNKVPVGYWLLGVAAVAGLVSALTAGAVISGAQ